MSAPITPSAPPAPLTHRRVLKIALPIVLSNATVPILGAVDVGVVGQLGEAAPIGAVAMGAIILSICYALRGLGYQLERAGARRESRAQNTGSIMGGR